MIQVEKPKKLTKHFKSKWLKALSNRSFIKTEGDLTEKIGNRRSYCCLGVADRICGTSIDYLNRESSTSGLNNSGLSSLSPKNLEAILQHEQNLIELNDENPTWKQVREYIKTNM